MCSTAEMCLNVGDVILDGTGGNSFQNGILIKNVFLKDIT